MHWIPSRLTSTLMSSLVTLVATAFSTHAQETETAVITWSDDVPVTVTRMSDDSLFENGGEFPSDNFDQLIFDFHLPAGAAHATAPEVAGGCVLEEFFPLNKWRLYFSDHTDGCHISVSTTEIETYSDDSTELALGEFASFMMLPNDFYRTSVATHFESGTIPPGMEPLFGGHPAYVMGTPTQVGTYTFTVKTEDGWGNSATQDFTLTVTGQRDDLEGSDEPQNGVYFRWKGGPQKVDASL